MILLERTRENLDAGFSGRTRLNRAVRLLEGKRSGALAAQGTHFWKGKEYWKKGKRTLRLDSADKCAYCEAPTAAVAHGDVEHFRPKSVYWWLAYCYDNYLFACQICNETHKGDNFPIGGTRLRQPRVTAGMTATQLERLAATVAPEPTDAPAVAAYAAAVAAERAELIDPYHVDPEPLLKWSADDVLKEVTVEAGLDTAAGRRIFAAVEKFYGLNREELRRIRWSLVYRQLRQHRDDLAELDADGVVGRRRERIAERLNEMMKPGEAFAGMARYFVRSDWRLVL